MIEIPEAAAYSAQLEKTIHAKRIAAVEADHSPHKFAWYCGDPKQYPSKLTGKTITGVQPAGGMVVVSAEGMRIVLSEGAGIRFFEDSSHLPEKHQLLLRFEDGSYLVVSVRMYGGIFAFPEGEFDNPYYLDARDKPDPLHADFNRAYFDDLLALTGIEKLSAKAFLATEQRIPGLGNGTLQDILFHAGVHPKRKMGAFSAKDIDALFFSIKNTLKEMAEKGGRDTEKGIFGEPGGYATKCSRLTAGRPCAVCGSKIEKGNYLGGSIYFCPRCQLLG